jgi:uncharacterized protein (DUF3820 family)
MRDKSKRSGSARRKRPPDANERPVAGRSTASSSADPRSCEATRITDPDGPRCSHCGSARLREIRLDSVPHFARLMCAECGRYVKFLPAPWTMERALAFQMPFGKYKGASMAELSRDSEGLSYLAWAARSIQGNPGTAARLVLETMGQA